MGKRRIEFDRPLVVALILHALAVGVVPQTPMTTTGPADDAATMCDGRDSAFFARAPAKAMASQPDLAFNKRILAGMDALQGVLEAAAR